jgi:hypothetical protein
MGNVVSDVLTPVHVRLWITTHLVIDEVHSGREGLWEGVVCKKVRGTQGGQNERDGLDEHSARRTSRYISYYMLLCYMSRTGNNKPYSKVPK